MPDLSQIFHRPLLQLSQQDSGRSSLPFLASAPHPGSLGTFGYWTCCWFVVSVVCSAVVVFLFVVVFLPAHCFFLFPFCSLLLLLLWLLFSFLPGVDWWVWSWSPLFLLPSFLPTASGGVLSCCHCWLVAFNSLLVTGRSHGPCCPAASISRAQTCSPLDNLGRPCAAKTTNIANAAGVFFLSPMPLTHGVVKVYSLRTLRIWVGLSSVTYCRLRCDDDAQCA